MRYLKEENLDQYIKESIQSELDTSEQPLMSSKESYEQIKARIQSREQKKRLPKFSYRYLVALSAVLLASLLVFSPGQSEAYTKLVNMFQGAQDSVVQIFTTVGREEIEGPIDDDNAPVDHDFTEVEGSEVVMRQYSFDEAQQKTAFSIVIPQNIPVDYTLKDVTVIGPENQESNEIILNYTSGENEFTIHQIYITGKYSAGLFVDANNTKKVMVNDWEGYLVKLNKNDIIGLSWATSNFHFQLFGSLSEQEIFKMAESM